MTNLAQLRVQAAACTACPLYEKATQTVFGKGPATAAVMLVGEAPGDHEDVEGAPFVGPAGRLLRASLDAIGVDVDDVYLTNAVKHFKWEPRGKSRIHKQPAAGEITACHPWLDRELAVVQPAVVVAMGVTAARSVLGRPVKITAERGRVIGGGPAVVVTIHPSAILRARDREVREDMRTGFEADLRLAAATASSTVAR